MRAFMLLVLALATPAAAQPVATCEGGLNPGRILACTELLRADQSPDRAIAIYKNRAQAYRSSGQNDLALKDYDTVLTVSPKEPEAIYGRGWALYSLKFHNRALADADRLIALGKGELYAIHQLRCRVLAALGRFDEAIQACTDQLRPFASHIFLMDRGEMYLLAGQYDLAIGDFDAALRADKLAARAKLGRGKAMFAKGNYGAALHEFDEANRIMETMSGQAWAMALSKRGLANEALGHSAAAIADFQKALKTWPDLEESREGLKRLGVPPAPLKP